MVTNRVTVSLDENAQSAFDRLIGRTDKARGELVREVLVLYATNFETATTGAGSNLEAYHQMLSSGEHVLLDVDFLHTFLDYVESNDGEPAPEFLDAVDRVAAFHVHKYHDRFESPAELLDRLSSCGFPTIRASGGDTLHVVFSIESVKWFMSRFIVLSTEQPPFDIEVEKDVSKMLLTEAQ